MHQMQKLNYKSHQKEKIAEISKLMVYTGECKRGEHTNIQKQWEKEAKVKKERKEKNIDADLLQVSLEKSYNNI